MTFTISIGHVSGDEIDVITTHSLERAIEFLKQYDHEGSSISFQIESDEPNEVYPVLYHLVTLPKGD